MSTRSKSALRILRAVYLRLLLEPDGGDSAFDDGPILALFAASLERSEPVVSTTMDGISIPEMKARHVAELADLVLR